MELLLYTSAFCAPCASARATLAQARRLVPQLRVIEKDVVRFESDAVADEIRSTPTVIMRGADGAELFRAAGAPRIDKLLAVVAEHIDG